MEGRKVMAAATTSVIGRGRVNGNPGHTENSNSISWPVDQHRWPGKSKQNQANFMNRSLDCGVLLRNLTGFENVVKSLQNSLLDP